MTSKTREETISERILIKYAEIVANSQPLIFQKVVQAVTRYFYKENKVPCNCELCKAKRLQQHDRELYYVFHRMREGHRLDWPYDREEADFIRRQLLVLNDQLTQHRKKIRALYKQGIKHDYNR